LTSMGLIPPKRGAKTPGATLKRPFEDIIKSEKSKGRKTTSKRISSAIKFAPTKKSTKKKGAMKIKKTKALKKQASKTPTQGKKQKVVKKGIKAKTAPKKPKKAPVKAAKKTY